MIQLTETQISILGRPNFVCANIAKILIRGGVYAKGPAKIEYEQAVFIHWANALYLKLGDEWSEEGERIIKEIFNNLSEGK